MTKQEAVDLLKDRAFMRCAVDLCDMDCQDCYEALYMAIEALEQESSDDLISRQDALDAIAKFVPYVIDDMSTESYTNGLRDAYNLIYQLPIWESDTE